MKSKSKLAQITATTTVLILSGLSLNANSLQLSKEYSQYINIHSFRGLAPIEDGAWVLVALVIGYGVQTFTANRKSSSETREDE